MSHLNTRNTLFLGLACSSMALTACQLPIGQHQTVKLNPVGAHDTVTTNNTVTTKASTPAKKAPSTAKAKSHKPHWGYGEEGTIAPAQWGNLEGNATCKTGEKQSPINIKTVFKVEKPLNLNKNYQAENFTAKNNGHTVVFNASLPARNQISVNGKVFNLLQFHYHAPSEHQVMGTNYPLEIHFVHKSQDGQLAVVGVMYNIGQNNAQLEQVVNNLVKEDKTATLSMFDVSSIMPADKTTFAYSGSLTTPPCSEKVQWLVQKTPVNIGAEQLEKFTDLYKANNRPVQPQNGRIISFN